MSTNINLVSSTKQSTPRIEKVKKLRYITFGMLFFVAVLSFLLFLINIRLSLGFIKTQQNIVMQDFSALDKTSSKIYIRNSRLSDISSILNTRKKYNVTAEKILGLIPSDVTVGEFKLDQTGFTISLSSPTLLSLNEFLNDFLNLTEGNQVSNVTLDGLTANEAGFTMTVKAQVL